MQTQRLEYSLSRLLASSDTPAWFVRYTIQIPLYPRIVLLAQFWIFLGTRRTEPCGNAMKTDVTFIAPAPFPLVLADAAATAVFAPAPHALVLAEATATAVFAPVPFALVLADAAAATLFTFAPLPLILADAGAAKFAPPLLVLAEAAAPTLITLVPSVAGARRSCCHHSLYTCSSATGACTGHYHRSLCTCSSRAGALPLVLAQAATTAVFAHAPHAQRTGALRGFLAAKGYGAGAVSRPDALAGFAPHSSCLWRFSCGSPGTCSCSESPECPAPADVGTEGPSKLREHQIAGLPLSGRMWHQSCG